MPVAIADRTGADTTIAAMGAGGRSGTALLGHRTSLGLMAAPFMLALALILVLRLSIKTHFVLKGKML